MGVLGKHKIRHPRPNPYPTMELIGGTRLVCQYGEDHPVQCRTVASFPPSPPSPWCRLLCSRRRYRLSVVRGDGRRHRRPHRLGHRRGPRRRAAGAGGLADAVARDLVLPSLTRRSGLRGAVGRHHALGQGVPVDPAGDDHDDGQDHEQQHRPQDQGVVLRLQQAVEHAVQQREL